MQNRFIAPLAALALLAAACVPTIALAQPYPAKPAKIVVGYTPGGSNDVLARVVAKHLQDTWKQPFVVENKPGASGQIGADTGAKATPDGYTLVVIPNDVLTVQPHMYPKFPFDPMNDVQPVATLGTVPIALVVNANSPYKTVAELIAAAKAKPGTLNYASSGAGGPQHMSAEMFMLLTGTKMVHVPYKGNAPAITDLLGGQVDILFSPINSALPHIKAGKLRALAVASEKRVASLPEVPTLVGSGRVGLQERDLDRALCAGEDTEGHRGQDRGGSRAHAGAGGREGTAERAGHRSARNVAGAGGGAHQGGLGAMEQSGQGDRSQGGVSAGAEAKPREARSARPRATDARRSVVPRHSIQVQGAEDE